jgi:hypothetical protein
MHKFQLHLYIILVCETHKITLSCHDIYLDVANSIKRYGNFVLIWELDIVVDIFLILERDRNDS